METTIRGRLYITVSCRRRRSLDNTSSIQHIPEVILSWQNLKPVSSRIFHVFPHVIRVQRQSHNHFEIPLTLSLSFTPLHVDSLKVALVRTEYSLSYIMPDSSLPIA